FASTAADRGDERLDLFVLEQTVDTGALDVEDLPPDGQDRRARRVTGPLGAPAGAVTLHDEELGLLRVLRGAVGELARHRRRLEERLSAREITRLASRDSGPSGLGCLVQDLAGLGGVLLEPVAELLVRGLLDRGPHLGVAELRLGLTFET